MEIPSTKNKRISSIMKIKLRIIMNLPCFAYKGTSSFFKKYNAAPIINPKGVTNNASNYPITTTAILPSSAITFHLQNL